MKTRTFIAALLLCASMSAAAIFDVVSKAYEVSFADLRLPQSSSGTLSFKPCDECDYLTVRVTAATRYEANNEHLTLADFRVAVAQLSNRQRIPATVLHHLESDTIEAIRVNF